MYSEVWDYLFIRYIQDRCISKEKQMRMRR